MDAIGVVEQEVRELVRRRGLDPAGNPLTVRQLVDDVVSDYDDRSLSGSMPSLADPSLAARQVYDAVAGLGPLQPHLDDPLVEEIWINAPVVFIVLPVTVVFALFPGFYSLRLAVP